MLRKRANRELMKMVFFSNLHDLLFFLNKNSKQLRKQIKKKHKK